jgi:sn-glycerol 3-phosphate transport system substrate-binding protein
MNLEGWSIAIKPDSRSRIRSTEHRDSAKTQILRKWACLYYPTELNFTMDLKPNGAPSGRPLAAAAGRCQVTARAVRTRQPGALRSWRKLVLAVLLLTPWGGACAETRVEFWHAMEGELGRHLEELVAGFNRFQSGDRVVLVYKGNYTDVITAAIFAMRTRSQPAIVQVSEAANATMIAARGAIYPVSELMHERGLPFDSASFLPVISGYSADRDGNLLSLPFNTSTPILYYNRNMFRAAGLDDNSAPKTWPEVEAAAARLRQSGVPCGFTTHLPSWVHVENFSALHDVPIATRSNGLDGLDAVLAINNPVMVRHVAELAKWQATGVFDYSGRGRAAEPRFPAGQCGIFLGSSALRPNIAAKSSFDVGYGMLPHWPDAPGAPQNSLIGGATLWVLRGRPGEEYDAVARFFTYLSHPEVQAKWHQNTGYLPVTAAAWKLTRDQGFYDRSPGAAIAIEQVTHKPPTENSHGLRLGSFMLIREVIEDELEEAFAGRKSAQDALDSAVKHGNELLRQFERATR